MVEQAPEQEAMMQLIYDEKADAASVLVGGPIEPGGPHAKDRLDEDRFVRRSEIDGSVLEYEFLNVRRYGVRLNDLEHHDELAAIFHHAGIPERDWSMPGEVVRVVRRRRDIAAG